MGTVFAQASVSLDGFIAGPGGTGFDRLFAWCAGGDVETPSADPDRLTYRTSAATAGYLRELTASTRACVVGRRQFDLTGGWGGRHPMGVPVFVVTHHRPADWPRDTATPFTFVHDGVESAIEQARRAARGGDVGVGPGSTVAQALDADLLDEIRLDLVPVLLGGGLRMLDGLGTAPVGFGTPRVIAGDGVTHLVYRRDGRA
ncbi:deaminase [Microtetraspora sp. NBRC 13810]|uniref:dihydrofolate reductase family protein n=1 Tax=Microtetraspora sp. NBRC 13810 TaxID=3030990 RepID=UPI0024A3A584|nr:dihydrofolate reductase family protein [Microtetraspora sp. NBRC 13810]GLW09986.1 deaminase [Microtetraspora sp. NBRC 13810]